MRETRLTCGGVVTGRSEKMKCGCGRPVSRYMKGVCLACRYEAIKNRDAEERDGEMKKVVPKQPVSCKYCGKQFFPPHRLTKYCSIKCKKEADKQKEKRLIEKTCLRCGRIFLGGVKHSGQYCEECRKNKNSTKKGLRPPEKKRDTEAKKTIDPQKEEHSPITAHKVQPELEGAVVQEKFSNKWDEKQPEEKTVTHPKAKLKVDPSRMPKRGIQKMHSASWKGPENGWEKEIEEEEKTEAGFDMLGMLQAHKMF